jgi:CRISPR/Cas system CSM-associated protein Csm3 (group 7 of RAMP superfamily)
VSRPIHATLQLDLRTTTGFHPGSGDVRDSSDSPITYDGNGRPVLRATSITGALRHHLERPGLFTNREMIQLFGDPDTPSSIVVDDAVINNVVMERRQGVGIDRVTGTAAKGIKFDVDTIARGATFTVSMTATVDDKLIGLVEQCFATLGQRFQKGLIRFGARTTRGFGGIELLGTADTPGARYARVDDRQDPVAATWALARNRWPFQPISALSTAMRTPEAPTLEFTVNWTPELAAFSKAAISANATIPETAGVGTDDEGKQRCALLLAGASLKGVLRTAAEYQFRTVTMTNDAWQQELDTTAQKPRQADQIVLPGVLDLFGWTADASDGDDPQGAVAAVQIDDCYGTFHMRTDQWLNVVLAAVDVPTGDDASVPISVGIRQALDDNNLKHWRNFVRNRINEVTGGVVDTGLFMTMVPYTETYEPFRIRLDLNRIGPSFRSAATAFLISTLREIHRHELTIGHGASQGFGRIVPDSITVAVLDGPMTSAGPGPTAVPTDVFGDELAEWRADLGTALSDWYDTFTASEAA